ncbi:MAG: MoaD/ThiS family protein [Allomuricauda sp.]|jgi:molybdopterin converting factor small subunit|uniref:MoaD/ThiS family protein n=1 Tax=Flavobacteriaceae TaxID=49546 RepID=UPI001B109731|nr:MULTISPECIES: MoaD/ThiS family protein [unclassified Allomuricauda]MBO6589309.1 MoaD/ThiS family protein [Allomuricauda sp.]MBO6618934.1 MoaD/ThiS family protein [Allomuricauda sp.]MBO6644846.1 MoaD/ThiS family protein [Allomuricauda sp.]MBO6746747.1 MoaD/ThiS family protein [Allomuricauda sp.]MBO6843170.1 MoaD/ThiS family protein [Allomuricauda sp.]
MTILLFGATKDIIGTPTLSVPTASLSGKKIPNTVGELKKFLESTYPELKKISKVTVAVNQNYASDHDSINSYDEIALIPPPNV